LIPCKSQHLHVKFLLELSLDVGYVHFMMRVHLAFIWLAIFMPWKTRQQHLCISVLSC